MPPSLVSGFCVIQKDFRFTQNLVDAFPMKATGYPISDAQKSGYDPEDPYNGRDNRFYLNIYYHGAVYGNP